MSLHKIQLEFERLYAMRLCHDDDMSGARLHALRAVAPLLIAAGLREAATLWSSYTIPGHAVVEPLMTAANNAMLRRAQELDPK